MVAYNFNLSFVITMMFLCVNYHVSLICSIMDEHLGSFQSGNVMNSAV